MDNIISDNQPMEYYTDKGNIPNQTIVRMTISHFETTRKGMYGPLEFLNILNYQCEHIFEDGVISRLQQLPLTDEQKHVLYGFILLWKCCGNPDMFIREEQRVILKRIRKIFLAFPNDTPEKEYCTTENYNKMEKIRPEYFLDIQRLIQFFIEELGYDFGKSEFEIEKLFKRWLEDIECYADEYSEEYKSYLTVENFKKFISDNSYILNAKTNDEYYYIKMMKRGTWTKWNNGKFGSFKDFDNNCMYRFCETDDAGRYTLQKESELRKIPALVSGFVAWLIKHWGEDTEIIYSGYLQARLSQYKDKHKADPDVHKRDLEREFYDQHQITEALYLSLSNEVLKYITETELKKINEFVMCYFDYLIQFKVVPEDINNVESESNADVENPDAPQEYTIETTSKENRNIKVPKRDFESFLIRKDEKIIERLHSLLDNNSSGIDVAKIFDAIEEANIVSKFGRYVNAAIRYFNIECKNQSIVVNHRKGKFTESEKNQIIDEII